MHDFDFERIGQMPRMTVTVMDNEGAPIVVCTPEGRILLMLLQEIRALRMEQQSRRPAASAADREPAE